MSYPINYPTPQGANVQIFNAPNRSGANNGVTWVKPQGASFVWFTLIGSGANGDGATTGGGSGAVTNFMCPAFLIPDELSIRVGSRNPTTTSVLYQQKDGTGYLLLSAEGGTGATAGAATAANAFTAMGFYQSIAGQNGTTGAVSASGTTFLSGGAASGGVVTSNYGYSTNIGNASGFFQLQPIIVGVGGSNTGRGGIGCGGGVSAVGPGGDGLVVIITW
jgi:hypothetical protein